MNMLLKIVGSLIVWCLFPVSNWIVEVENASPVCCDEKAEFRGHQISLFHEVFHYQCLICKKTFVVHNPQKGIALRHLWFLIFCPKIEA